MNILKLIKNIPILKDICWYLYKNCRFLRKGNNSQGEIFITHYCKSKTIKYKTQVKFKFNEVVRNANYAFVDFVVIHPITHEKYVIEYNGRQHYEYAPFFHRNGIIDLEKQQRRDELVKQKCIELGYHFVEIPYTMNVREIEIYLNSIFE